VENFDIGVYVNILPQMTSGEAGPSGDVFGHEENEGKVGEGSSDAPTGEVGKVGEDSSDAPTGEVHPLEIDAGCMDDEGGRSEVEHATDNDDPTPTIQYFCVIRLLECTIVDSSRISVWGYHISDI
jgi:hypothetical protein